jgi:hypothetical protein
MCRWVRGRLCFARGNQVRLQLIEDDPWATVSPFLAGERGWFSRCMIRDKKKIVDNDDLLWLTPGHELHAGCNSTPRE